MNVSAAGAFTSADHFPLGSRQGVYDAIPEPVSEARPFGLTLAQSPRLVPRVNHYAIGYDADRQIGIVLDNETGSFVPLARHTDGQTGTVTHGDGNGRNDSDTDHRED
jgi:putative ATP-grasp target RiPP